MLTSCSGLEKAGVDFVAADMPAANRLTVGIMAMVADEERRMIFEAHQGSPGGSQTPWCQAWWLSWCKDHSQDS